MTKTLPCKVKQLTKYTFNITLMQGLNRQIRRMCLSTQAMRSVICIESESMNIHLDGLALGQWRDLTKDELSELFKELDYTPRQR